MTQRSIHKGLSVGSILILALAFLQTGGIGQLREKDLLKSIGIDAWSPEELSALERGEPVVRSLETKEKQELAAIGVVRISNLPPISMNAFRDSLSQKRADEKIAGGRFSDPPMADDLRDLELEPDTIAQLQKCTVGKCDLNLPAQMIKRFEEEVNWNSPDADAVASRLMRDMLLGYVRGYTSRGDTALGRYDNRRTSVDLEAAHRSLLSSSVLIRDLAPEFVDYLAKFPFAKLENVDSAMSWSVIDFGLKPSITLSHSAAYTKRTADDERLFLASKQIYSSRYLDSSLTFTLLLRVPSAYGVDTYLIFSDRSRSDALDGPLGGIARDVVRKESLERIRTLLDKAHLRLLAAGNSKNETDHDAHPTEADSAAWVKRILQNRIAAAVLVVFIVGALYAVWRWKLK
jgi:hypothetical protein